MIDSERLKVPHPHLHERAFVLYPLADIAPDLDVPGRGLLTQLLWRALALALANTGNKIAARMAMIAMTTSSSMSVNPRRFMRSPLPLGTHARHPQSQSACYMGQFACLGQRAFLYANCPKRIARRARAYYDRQD